MYNIGMDDNTRTAPTAPAGADGPAPSLTAVVTTFPAPSQTFIRRKLEGLRDAGLSVTVAASDIGSGAAALGFGVLPLAPWRHPVSSVRGAPATVVGALRAVPARGSGGWRSRVVQAPLATATTDIVHVEFSGIAVTYLPALRSLKRHHRLAVSCRGAAEQIEPLVDPGRIDALAEVFDMVDLIHCVSDDMRRTVEALGAPPGRILVNRPAVPTADLAPLRGPAADHGGPLRILCIGRLHWKKGLDAAVRAVAELSHRGCGTELRIVGEGPERPRLTFTADRCGVADRVTLLGSRTSDEVRDQLAWTDVLLLPSLSEGISNAVLEAMAAGLPVVTTDCGGMEEVVTDGVDGMVVPVTDVTAMADRLETLAADPDLRTALGAAAAARADADFDLSRQIRLFSQAYRTLVSGNAPSRTPNERATSATSRSEDRPSS